MNQWRGFYQLPVVTRRERIGLENIPTLSDEVGNQMIENYVFSYGLPQGVLPQIQVNGVVYTVPMVVEEPSVIAAASNGAKRLGNITARVLQRELVGQIILLDVPLENLKDEFFEHLIPQWLMVAETHCASMVARGGGPRACWWEQQANYTCVYISLDPCDAMGANTMNSLLEALSPLVAQDLSGSVLMSILSNNGDRTLVEATVTVPIRTLDSDEYKALSLARRIAQASEVAQLFPYRAVTHNKGIMNGVDAVLIATGNDWRAVNAAVHAYASESGKYRGLSTWDIDSTQSYLQGRIILPLPIATVGGTMAVHPVAQWNHHLLQQPNAEILAELIAAVGLAQNFAALRAIVSEGIQKGHMALHARSLSVQAGATEDEIADLVAYLQTVPKMNLVVAQEGLTKIRQDKR